MDSETTSKRLGDLASRYVEESVRLWQGYADGLRRVAESALPRPGEPGPAGAMPVPDPLVFARDLTQLNLAHYSNLIQTYADFTNLMVASVFQPAAAPPAAPAARTPEPAKPAGQPPAPSIELVFSGRPGEAVSQSFMVANKQSESIDVAFEISEFVSEDGTARFRAPVTFVPDRFQISPGAERVVECRIQLGAPFAAGARYLAIVRIAGFPGMETALIVVPQGAAARAPDEGAPALGASAPDRPAAAGKTARQRGGGKAAGKPGKARTSAKPGGRPRRPHRP